MIYLYVYPFATVSSAALYAVLLLLAFPNSRRRLAPYLTHPIPPTQQSLAGFDALRGLAAALIAFGHLRWTTLPVFQESGRTFIDQAAKGVPIFATLSGFLIYRSVLQISSLEGLRTYVCRRFFRVYPVYALGIALCLAFGHHYVSGEDYGPLGYFLSDVFMFHIIEWPGPLTNSPTWSLYIECVFYAFLPLAVLVLRRERVVACGTVLLVAMIIADSHSSYFGLWKYFGVGVLASELSPRMSRAAVPLFALGTGLLVWDFGGPKHDWFADLTGFHRDNTGETIALGIACGLIAVSLPHVQWAGRALNILPLRALGAISYSVYITQIFYILAIFPILQRFSNAGTPEMAAYFRSLPPMPGWYLPLLFYPGVFFWGLLSFLLVERPGMLFGRWLLTRAGASAQPVPADQMT